MSLSSRKRRRDRVYRPASTRLLRVCATILLMSAMVYPHDQRFPDVTAFTLEDLINMKVTSVSKREQKLADAPAAIFVITQEDIRRSGARNIPEALRLAPGVEVARIDENKWAITARGFNGRFANKLLVLIDGRSVYTPLFSGVNWNVQDVFLDDVDRIEVIRGPGATLWGANAVNGVINIITKAAEATQGVLITAEGGNDLKAVTSVRYGGKIGQNTHYRAYSKYFNWNSSTDIAGNNAFDDWDTTRGGFRIDSDYTPDDSLTLQGELYRGSYGETLTASQLIPPYQITFRNSGNFSGGNVLGRWNHAFTKSKTSLQLYYDRTNTSAESLLSDHQNIYDLDFQHDIRVSEGNELIWGAGYRYTQDKIHPSNYVSIYPDHRGLSWLSAFTQDEFGLFKQRLRVTVGSKFEHNDFTGFEVEPNARLLWNVSSKHSFWGAISRAVRTPARAEQDVQLTASVQPPSAATNGLPVLANFLGDRGLKSEDLVAYEAGYRFQVGSSFSADFAGFYNSYSNLVSAEPQPLFLETNPLPPHLTMPMVVSNKRSGAAQGMEFLAEWRVAAKWKVTGSYGFLTMDIHPNADSLDTTSVNPGGASPRHQYYIRSSFDPTKAFEQDVTLRYVHSLSNLAIPSYYSLDARLGWKPAANIELSVSGQNLTDNRHLEFRPDFISTSPTQVKRSLQGSLTFRF